MFRDTKVGDLAYTIQVDKNVISLQISMQNVARMQVRQAINDLIGAVPGQALIEATFKLA